ncbi:hypothetical protein BT69DRAFT_1277714 [Atractiella rhizophila]|nr:hypothetical protein BT69DRAFT_1277714 [Atractiella rhizophila]
MTERSSIGKREMVHGITSGGGTESWMMLALRRDWRVGDSSSLMGVKPSGTEYEAMGANMAFLRKKGNVRSTYALQHPKMLLTHFRC